MDAKDCRDCGHCAMDMDGLYCAHETSMKSASPFGWGIERARTDGHPCGPQAVHFQIAPIHILRARRRAPATEAA